MHPLSEFLDLPDDLTAALYNQKYTNSVTVRDLEEFLTLKANRWDTYVLVVDSVYPDRLTA